MHLQATICEIVTPSLKAKKGSFWLQKCGHYIQFIAPYTPDRVSTGAGVISAPRSLSMERFFAVRSLSQQKEASRAVSLVFVKTVFVASLENRGVVRPQINFYTAAAHAGNN